MAGSYYSQADTKVMLNIPASDTGDDTLLDNFGNLANQHIDNILEIYDEKIPLQGSNVLNDIKMAANFYVSSLYKAHRNDKTMADHWMGQFDSVIDGLKQQKLVDNPVYVAERHMGKGRRDDHDHFLDGG